MNLSNSLFQVSPVPMWVYDTKTFNFLTVNTAAINLYGYKLKEFLSSTIHLLEAESEAGQSIIRHLKKNGEVVYTKVESAEINYEGIQAILVTAVDLTAHINNENTARLHNEAKIKLNAEKFDVLSKATSDTVWDSNLLTNKITWNKGIKGIFGYKNLEESTTAGEWWPEHIHPDDRNRVMNDLHTNIENKITRWKEEYRFLCADGSYKYVLDRSFMVFNESGIPVRIIGSMQDISQRKQEEQWSRLLESVVINATDAVLICTGNIEGSGQAIIYVNEAFTKMSGYQKAELIGASPRISQGPETDFNEIKKLKNAIEHKIPCQIEVINYTKQGKEYWVSQSNAPISDASGEVTHWISIQRDITQNKKHLKEIEEQNKKFKEIAWIQSHLVRAPLARVMGLVDLLKNFKPGDQSKELLLHLERSARELDSIIINIADRTPGNHL